MTFTFYSLRHAQTTYNLNKLFTGFHDPLLTPEGSHLASSLDLSPFDFFLSSKLQRCSQTLLASGITYFETDCRLNEICLGELQGQSISNIQGYIDSPLDYSPLGGESYRLASYRIISLLFELFYRLSVFPHSKYLLCTSSGIIRILKSLEYKPKIEDFHSIKTPNCQITKHTLNLSDVYYLSKL